MNRSFPLWGGGDGGRRGERRDELLLRLVYHGFGAPAARRPLLDTSCMNSPMPTPLSSDRMFGLIMAAFLLLLAAIPLLSGKGPRLWVLAISAAFLLPALLFPKALAPFNKLWTRFGLLLSRVVSPLALAVLFFAFITPYGWLMRRLGKSHIPVGFDAGASSYWTAREPPGPEPESLRDQF